MISNTVRKYIEEGIKIYNGIDSNGELEIKIPISNSDEFNQYYNAFKKDSSGAINEDSMNVIKGKDRKEIYFKNNKKISEQFIRKNRLKDIKINTDIFNIKISVSSEDPIKSFNISGANLIRIKKRQSLTLKTLDNWRIDMTIVKTIEPKDFEKTISIKNEFFKTPFGEYFNNSSNVKTDKFELEIEYTGDKIEYHNLVESISGIVKILVPDYETSMIYTRCISDIHKKIGARYVKNMTIKQIANQPITIDFQNYSANMVPNITNYYLSDKVDGQRCFLYVNDMKVRLVMSDKIIDINIAVSINANDTFIYDAEYLHDDKELYLFDALYIDNKSITNLPFSERLPYIDAAVAKFNNKKLSIMKKIQIKLTSSYSKQIKDMHNRKTRTYDIDGLIFTPDNKSYNDMRVFKWKPPAKQTIDFLIMRPPKNLIGIEPYVEKTGHKIYFLFVGINLYMFKNLGLTQPQLYDELFMDYTFVNNYFPVAFSTSSDKYAYIYQHPDSHKISDISGHVGEFGNAMNDLNLFSLHKMRPERDVQVEKGLGYGNDYKTAEMIFLDYKNPFTLEKLTNPEKFSNVSYFIESKQTSYKYMTKFNAYVKTNAMMQLKNVNTVMDLAAGKGQDLFTLHGLGVKNAIFVDKDVDAISELNKRKFNLGQNQWYMYMTPKPAKHMEISTKVLDLTGKSDILIKSLSDINILKKNSVDGVIINFAIHYIINSAETLDNVINLIDYYLSSGGIFIFTCFDGARIFDMLKDVKTGDSYDIKQGNDVKYSIKKLYDDKKFVSYGMKISVIHPFSAGEYYEENLIDIQNIVNHFIKKKYTILTNNSFGDMLAKYEKAYPDLFKAMSKEDKMYSSLYNYITIVK